MSRGTQAQHLLSAVPVRLLTVHNPVRWGEPHRTTSREEEDAMEVLFENVYIDTEQGMLELYRQRGKGKRRLIMLLFAVYTVIALLLVVLKNTVYSWILLALCIGYILYLLFIPRMNTKRYFNAIKKHYDGVVPETRNVCTEEAIVVHFGDDRAYIPYDKITEIHFYDNAIFILAGVKGTTLQKHGFIKGTTSEFIEFLQKKCPNIKTRLPKKN